MVCIIFGGQVFYQVMNLSALSKDLLNLHKTPSNVLLAKLLTLHPYKVLVVLATRALISQMVINSANYHPYNS